MGEDGAAPEEQPEDARAADVAMDQAAADAPEDGSEGSSDEANADADRAGALIDCGCSHSRLQDLPAAACRAGRLLLLLRLRRLFPQFGPQKTGKILSERLQALIYLLL